MNYLEKLIAQQQKEYKHLIYVDYRRDATISKLTKSELEEKLDWLISSNYKFISPTTIRNKILPKTYSLTYNDRLIFLTYYDGKNYYWHTTNHHDDAKNIETPNSFKDFKKKFKNRTDKRMSEAFGRTAQSFKLYCPKPLYYINRDYIEGFWYNNISKEDFVSHYPSSALGILPDASTMLEVEGNVKPTKEYPFAFYPDSGNIAIYEEFDSRDWTEFVEIYSSNVKRIKFKPNYKAEDTKTVLMKASKYTLAEEVMFYFNKKSKCPKDSPEYHEAKIFLLKFIGMMEQCSPRVYGAYPFAHLAAVIKWRSNVKMFRTLKQLGYNNIIQVCVDGVIHKGECIGSYSSDIGELSIEFNKAIFVHRGINQYIIRDKSKEERKHSGLDVLTDSDSIMNWMASPKVDFITYMKENYLIKERTYGKKIY